MRSRGGGSAANYRIIARVQYPQTAFLEPGWILSLFARPAVIVLLLLIGMPRRHRSLRAPLGKYHSRLSRLPSHSTSLSPSSHIPLPTLLSFFLIVFLLILLMPCLRLLLYILVPLHILLLILLVLFLFCLIVVTAVLRSVPLCDAMFCVAMLCDAMLHYAMPHHAMTCYALPCSSTPCYAVLYHASRTLSGSLPCSTSDRANREDIYAMVRDGREG